MNDDVTKNQMDVSDIERELKDGQLSRRRLSDRLKVLGIGFGAAMALGVSGAHAATAPDTSIVLKSSNAALNSIIQSGAQVPTINPNAVVQQTAYYRYYHRYYNRAYSRYYSRY